jgi:hypothetical protein
LSVVNLQSIFVEPIKITSIVDNLLNAENTGIITAITLLFIIWMAQRLFYSIVFGVKSIFHTSSIKTTDKKRGSLIERLFVIFGEIILVIFIAIILVSTKSLKTISLSSENKNFSLVDNVLFNKDMSALVLYPCGDPRTDYVVPDTVFSIFNSYLGSAKNLVHLSIPSSVYNVGGFNLSMEAYNIFENGCYIGNDDNPYYIFAQALNDEVETITIHPDTQIIAEASLDSDSLKTVYIPESVYLIGRQAGVFRANQVFFADPDNWYLNNNATPYKGSALTSSAISDPTTAAQMIYNYNQKYFRKVK